MKTDDRIKYMISGYFGIKKMDADPSKLYILKDVEKHIKDYLRDNLVEGFDYHELADNLKNNTLKEQLQDALIVLNEINGPFDLILIIKRKVKELRMNDK